MDLLNPTAYAQVLVERGSVQGAAVKRYAVGDDVLGQEVGTAMQSLLMDGHGSTRQLYDAGVSESYDFDAYGEAFAWDLDDPSVLRRRAVGRGSGDAVPAGSVLPARAGRV